MWTHPTCVHAKVPSWSVACVPTYTARADVPVPDEEGGRVGIPPVSSRGARRALLAPARTARARARARTRGSACAPAARRARGARNTRRRTRREHEGPRVGPRRDSRPSPGSDAPGRPSGGAPRGTARPFRRGSRRRRWRPGRDHAGRRHAGLVERDLLEHPQHRKVVEAVDGVEEVALLLAQVGVVGEGKAVEDAEEAAEVGGQPQERPPASARRRPGSSSAA